MYFPDLYDLVSTTTAPTSEVFVWLLPAIGGVLAITIIGMLSKRVRQGITSAIGKAIGAGRRGGRRGRRR